MTIKRLDKYIASDICSDALAASVIGRILKVSEDTEAVLTKEIRIDEPNRPVFPLVKGNQDLVLTGDPGRIGAAILKQKNEEMLEKRFPTWFLKEVGDAEVICSEQEKLSEQLLVTLGCLNTCIVNAEAGKKDKTGSLTACITAAYAVSDGGLYRPLYQLGKDTGKGYRVDYHKLPIRQTTIEICEVFDADPLRMFTGLSMLIVTPEGNRLARELKAAGVEAAIIGYTTNDKDKLLIHDGVESRINRPEPDELLKNLM